MRVVTLDNKDFADICRSLEKRVSATGYVPDLVVGVATGGMYVSQHIMSTLPHAVMVCRRPSTVSKEENIKLINIVNYLPLWCRNILRIMESLVLRNIISKELPSVNTDIRDESMRAGSCRILVVDDAVDSGITLKTVVEAVSELAPHAEIRTATITVTIPRPVLMPDYYIYNNGTLIRFPWSKDAVK